MKSVFRHRLKSARRFVFENIMDLEHVCALHRRWFRNLRVRVRRDDYVEYRLTSLFYGLRQDVVAAGDRPMPTIIGMSSLVRWLPSV
jgi:hypothetical protein